MQVCKTSGKNNRLEPKPFKSGKKINTVKGIVTHPILSVPAYTFIEDDSILECRRCVQVQNLLDLWK